MQQRGGPTRRSGTWLSSGRPSHRSSNGGGDGSVEYGMPADILPAKPGGAEEVSHTQTTVSTVSSQTTPTGPSGLEGFEMPSWEQPMVESLGKKAPRVKKQPPHAPIRRNSNNAPPPAAAETPPAPLKPVPAKKAPPPPPPQQDDPPERRSSLEGVVVMFNESSSSLLNDDITFVGDESLAGVDNDYGKPPMQQHHHHHHHHHHSKPMRTAEGGGMTAEQLREEEMMRLAVERSMREEQKHLHSHAPAHHHHHHSNHNNHNQSHNHPRTMADARRDEVRVDSDGQKFVWKKGPNGRFVKVPMGQALDQVEEEVVPYARRGSGRGNLAAPQPSEEELLQEALERSKRETQAAPTRLTQAELEQEQALLEVALQRSMRDEPSAGRDRPYDGHRSGGDWGYQHQEQQHNPRDYQHPPHPNDDHYRHRDADPYNNNNPREYDNYHRDYGGPSSSSRDYDAPLRDYDAPPRDYDAPPPRDYDAPPRDYDAPPSRDYDGYEQRDRHRDYGHTDTRYDQGYPGEHHHHHSHHRPPLPPRRASMGGTSSHHGSVDSRSTTRAGFLHQPAPSHTTGVGSSGGGSKKNFEWKRGPNGRFIKVPIQDDFASTDDYAPPAAERGPPRETEQERLARVEREMVEEAMRLSMQEQERNRACGY